MSEHQRAFTRDIGHLIAFAYENGYELTFGESYRTLSQQWLYFNGKQIEGGRIVADPDGRASWTMNSKHLKRLAVDFNLFKDDVWQQTTEAYRPLGGYWESLDERNQWGVFKSGKRTDGNHFQRNIE